MSRTIVLMELDDGRLTVGDIAQIEAYLAGGDRVKVLPKGVGHDQSIPILVTVEPGGKITKHLNGTITAINDGRTVLFTPTTWGLPKQGSLPNETPSNPTEKSDNRINQPTNWQQRYVQLRLALRNAILRQVGCKVEDTANIAEDLLNDRITPDEATARFQKLLQSAQDLARTSDKDATQKALHEQEKRHREETRKLLFPLVEQINRMIQGTYYTGGLVRPDYEPPKPPNSGEYFLTKGQIRTMELKPSDMR